MSRRGKGGGGDRRQQTSSPTEFDEDDMSSMDDMRRCVHPRRHGSLVVMDSGGRELVSFLVRSSSLDFHGHGC